MSTSNTQIVSRGWGAPTAVVVDGGAKRTTIEGKNVVAYNMPLTITPTMKVIIIT